MKTFLYLAMRYNKIMNFRKEEFSSFFENDLHIDTGNYVDRWIFCTIARQYEELEKLILDTALVCKRNNLNYDCSKIITEKVIKAYKNDHFFCEKLKVHLVFDDKASTSS